MKSIFQGSYYYEFIEIERRKIMRNQIEVKLDFINKKGQLKHVKFYMNKQTYEMLFDKSISEEVRHQYLVDEYHEYERERYYRRKFISLNNDLAE